MKSTRWLKFRHRVIRNIAGAFIWLYSVLKYNITIVKFKEQEKRPYFILYNHQTAFDQFFVGMSFKGPIYYVASDDLFSNGFVSKLIKWLVAPIPIKKQATDIGAVMNCLRIAKEGGTIAIAPEGNRTYSGKTEYMNPAIIPLIKKLRLPLVFYHIEGGYGVHPRWSDDVRKGKMKSYVHKVMMPEEYKDLTNEELYEIVKKEMYVNEAKVDGLFKSPKRAEYIERAMYVCPFCGLAVFESEGEHITCKKCGAVIRYNEDKTLSGVNREFPFKFINDWYEYQQDFVNKINLDEYISSPMYEDTAIVRRVIASVSKEVLSENSKVALYGDRVIVDDKVITFEDIDFAAVLGRNKLNLYTKEALYQFKGNKRFNAVKYVNMFYHYKNIKEGKEDVKFLGL